MKKKFAFLLMGKEFDTAKDTAVFETEHMISYIFTVTSFEEALKRAVACAEDGVGAIEVCGAFGKEWADEIILRMLLSTNGVITIIKPIRRCWKVRGKYL